METLEYIKQDYSNNGLSDVQNHLINETYKETLYELNNGSTVQFIEKLLEICAENGHYEQCSGIQRALKQYYENKTQ